MTNQEIKQEILDLLGGIEREGIKETIDYLNDSDFFRTGCHSHHMYFGGLARHSLEACHYALNHNQSEPRESVIISSLLHDTCTSHSRATYGIRGHGSRSVKILERICHLNLTSDEREAILLHMHGDAPQMQTNSLARLVWKADKVSAAGKAKLN